MVDGLFGDGKYRRLGGLSKPDSQMLNGSNLARITTRVDGLRVVKTLSRAMKEYFVSSL
jgi:hypothetical protein